MFDDFDIIVEDIPEKVHLCGRHSRECGDEFFADGVSVHTGSQCDMVGCPGE